MNLVESLTKPFLKEPKLKDQSSLVGTKKIINDLSADSGNTVERYATGFYDNGIGLNYAANAQETLASQNAKINQYRGIAKNAHVDYALNIITNELIFSYSDDEPIKINVEIDNKKLKDAIIKAFNKVMGKMNVKRNLFNIFKSSYIDGQMIFHCSYNEKRIKDGIQEIKLIDPVNFVYDPKTQTYSYQQAGQFGESSANPKLKYSREEIVRENYGIYSGKIILSYLESVIKTANMLQNLEDLLIPLRFSRSISRRIFNIDIAGMPTTRGVEYLNKLQAEFKYKKAFNTETGEIKNNQHITSMVEDYWFANRNGGKGTQVETLDETGNLGELGDIRYFKNNLYTFMGIPTTRIPGLDGNGAIEFNFESTGVTQEDLAFFMFINRLRQVLNNAFREILKLECISTGIIKEREWDVIKDSVNVFFANDNKFIEKMEVENLLRKCRIFEECSRVGGSVLSYETLMKSVFRMTDEEIEDERKKIELEKKNKLYKSFYETPVEYEDY